MIPHGALTQDQYKKLKGQFIYYVRNGKHGMEGELKKFQAGFDGYHGKNWFMDDSLYGYFFSNYFHALAYSLKVKDEAGCLKNHSQPANTQPC